MKTYTGPLPFHKPFAKIPCTFFDNTERIGENPAEFTKRMSRNPEDPWFYEFNSKGYRGEEWDKGADIKIVAIGCSHTFGEGLKYKNTWPCYFKELLKAEEPSKNVNLVNLSQTGASNDYISRTAVTQIPIIKPHWVLILFTYHSRMEYLSGDKIFLRGAWVPDQEEFYEYYTEEDGIADTIKNALRIQYLCQFLKTKFIFAFVEYETMIFKIYHNANPALNALWGGIAEDSLCEKSITSNSVFCDYARDGLHTGPRSQQNMAREYFKIYKKMAP